MTTKFVSEEIASDELNTIRREYFTGSPQELVAKMAKDREAGFSDWLKELVRRSQEQLTENGWPEWCQLVAYHKEEASRTSWRALPHDSPRDDLRPGEWMSDGSSFIQRVSEPLTDDWFRCKISVQAERALFLISDNGDLDDLMFCVLEIGQLVQAFKTRPVLPSVRTGKKQRAALKELREKENAAKSAEAEEWRALAREIAQVSRLSGGALDVHVRDKLMEHGFHRSSRSIRDAIRDVKRSKKVGNTR